MIWWLTLTGFPLWWLTIWWLTSLSLVADNLWCLAIFGGWQSPVASSLQPYLYCKCSEKSGARTVKRRDQLQLGQVIRSSLERLDLEVGMDDVIQFEDKPLSSG
jgi:hypothetical protein